MKRPRLSRWAKWACTLAAISLVSITVLTQWWDIYWNSPIRGTEQWQVELAGGRFWVVHILSWKPIAQGWRVLPSQESWHWGWTDPPDMPPNAHWRCGFLYWKLPGVLNHFEMTLLYPLLVAVVAAGMLWRTDLRANQRERQGVCRSCGYDCRGLAADAACPECGTPTTTPTAPKAG